MSETGSWEPLVLFYFFICCSKKVCFSFFSSPFLKGNVSFCHHLASVVNVRRKLFQRSSPLKLLNQLQPNFSWMILRVFRIKIVFYLLFPQKRWPSWLKIEHRVKCSFWLISQKLKHKEQIWHWVNLFIRSRSISPEMFRGIKQPIVGLMPLNR